MPTFEKITVMDQLERDQKKPKFIAMKLNTATATLCAVGSNNPKVTRKLATWAPSRVRKAKQPPICEDSLAAFTQNCRRKTLCHAPAIMPSKGQTQAHQKTKPNGRSGLNHFTAEVLASRRAQSANAYK